jgi:hypothetical protein
MLISTDMYIKLHEIKLKRIYYHNISQIFFEKFFGDIFYFILNNANIIISQFYNFLFRAINVLQLGQ